jgi:hypothetical protein
LFTTNTALLHTQSYPTLLWAHLAAHGNGNNFKLDTNKASRATVAIAASYALGRVSKGTKYPQLAFANSIALIVIIAGLYINRLAPLAKKHTPLVCK